MGLCYHDFYVSMIMFMVMFVFRAVLINILTFHYVLSYNVLDKVVTFISHSKDYICNHIRINSRKTNVMVHVFPCNCSITCGVRGPVV